MSNPLPGTGPSLLVVTVDTEEEGLWTGNFRRHGNTVDNVREIPRFQALCDEFGIRPVYLVDAPVVEDDRSAELLGEIHDSGRCEIGAHLHPWCNPPLEEEVNTRHSFMCNLPISLQRSKLEWLTDRIKQRFGTQPASFRAGRYGLDIAGARLLVEAGYRVDSSVIPFSDFRAGHGPDFSRAPYRPYFVGNEDLCVPAGEPAALLEVPVTVGYNRTPFRSAQARVRSLNRTIVRPLRLEGILDRCGILRRIKFSPEQSDARAMTRLVNLCLAERVPAMVMMFHSSSLLPGGSPYVPDRRSLERFYASLRGAFEHCLTNRQMRTATLSEVATTQDATVQSRATCL